jgi:hypothetical protein
VGLPSRRPFSAHAAGNIPSDENLPSYGKIPKLNYTSKNILMEKRAQTTKQKEEKRKK